MKYRYLVFLLFPTSLMAQLPDGNHVFHSYLTFPESAPVIDGIISLGEWDAAGPPIEMSQAAVPWFNPAGLPNDPHGGDEDFSYRFRTMWTPTWDIYFLVEVTDDIAMDEAHDPVDVPWQRDAVEIFVDGSQIGGGNIKYWEATDKGPEQLYGKFGISRNRCEEDWEIGQCFEGNLARMHVDPEEVGRNGISASGVATETGEAANYFVEYHISMLDAYENGLFDGTSAGIAGTMVPDETSIKVQVSVIDNDNFGDENQWQSAGSWYRTDEVPDGSTEWHRSDRFPNLLMTGEYVPDTAPCDIDANGVCDVLDLNELLYAGIPSGDTMYDLNGSGTVDSEDVDTMLREINSLPGDANSDGVVNAQDLNAVGSNWQQTGITDYADGDFNGDGSTDAADLNIVGIYWTNTAADFASEAAPAAAVPEPNGVVTLLFGLALSSLRRRRS